MVKLATASTMTTSPNRHRIWRAAAAIVLALAAAPNAMSDDDSLAEAIMDKTEGCMSGPTAQFGRYIGDWNIQDEGLSPDGKTWSPGNGARWNFTCVGNGIAVQDFWMPNGPEGSPPPGVGTNLRIYDPKTEQWDIAWTSTNTPGFSHIRARQDETGNIVMHYLSPVQSPPRRITFFPPTDEGWNWVMEMSFDAGETWNAVYKIKATPRQ